MAWFALSIWPLVCIYLYKKMTLAGALSTSIIGGYLLLPSVTSLDLPLIPPLNKTTIPVFSAFILTMFALSKKENSELRVLKGWLPRSPIVLSLFIVAVVGAIGTAVTNQDPIVIGTLFIPGLRSYDSFSILLNLIVLIMPLLLGRRILASADAQKTFLTVLVVSATIYCFPALFEVRMSPQLHTKVYGFFPSSFVQAMRQGGFRPNVFLDHGLSLAMFFAMSFLAALSLYRMSDGKVKQRFLYATILIYVTLVLCKSLGALIIASILAPFILFAALRIQLIVGLCAAVMVITYPMLRLSNLVPVYDIIDFAGSISLERAESLEFRVNNEEALLDRARERPVFGWGGWNRNRVYDEEGNTTSVTDGAWIIAFGEGGWLRYFAVFGLMCWSITAVFLRRVKRLNPVTGFLVLILAAKLVDLLPNAGLQPMHLLIAGALIGRLELKSRPVPEEGVAPDANQSAESGASRDAEARVRYSRSLSRKGVHKRTTAKARRSDQRIAKSRYNK